MIPERTEEMFDSLIPFRIDNFWWWISFRIRYFICDHLTLLYVLISMRIVCKDAGALDL
jgi:hypothetical protein